MHDILFRFPVDCSRSDFLAAVSTCEGLNSWWTKSSEGKAVAGEIFRLGFGPDYQWAAQVTKSDSASFELTFNDAMDDWINSKVGFEIKDESSPIAVEFYHRGWREVSEHFRISSFCWAMYLRLLKRYVEFGEVVEYDKRLDV